MLPIEWAPKMKSLRMVKVFWILVSYVDINGECFPSKSTIAKLSGLREDHVRESLRELESVGAIKTNIRPGHSSSYQILAPKVIHSPLQKEGPNPGLSPEKEGDLNRGTRGTQSGSPKGDPTWGKGGPDLGPHIIPENKPSEKTNGTNAHARGTYPVENFENRDAVIKEIRATLANLDAIGKWTEGLERDEATREAQSRYKFLVDLVSEFGSNGQSKHRRKD